MRISYRYNNFPEGITDFLMVPLKRHPIKKLQRHYIQEIWNQDRKCNFFRILKGFMHVVYAVGF